MNDTLKSKSVISRKLWMAEKFLIFHTVHERRAGLRKKNGGKKSWKMGLLLLTSSHQNLNLKC